MNRNILNKIFPDALRRIEAGRCPICAEAIKPEEFEDKLSVQEFLISGTCQKCQDKIFA